MTNHDMRVNIAGVEFKNPVFTASGTFGSGKEYGEFVDLSKLGAVVTKGVSNVPWEGNPTIRIAETPSGMLNAIGLQNPGIDSFLKDDMPYLEDCGTKIIVNVCGHTIPEYVEVAERLSDTVADMLEINISCPNVKQGGASMGTDPSRVEEVTSEIKKHTNKPVSMKLSPNVTSIADIARAAESGGADALTLINSLTGMKIDVKKRQFVIANKTGGLSGPALHPIAVRMVYEAANAVGIPIIGVGGITNWEDALEMILAGATAVQVGSASFRNPYTVTEVIEGIEKYLEDNDISSVEELTGAVK